MPKTDHLTEAGELIASGLVLWPGKLLLMAKGGKMHIRPAHLPTIGYELIDTINRFEAVNGLTSARWNELQEKIRKFIKEGKL